jgi:predicted transcriptional regulator
MTRPKIAGRVYTLLSDKDLVTIKKIGPDTYITITQKGEDLSREFLNRYRFG